MSKDSNRRQTARLREHGFGGAGWHGPVLPSDEHQISTVGGIFSFVDQIRTRSATAAPRLFFLSETHHVTLVDSIGIVLLAVGWVA